MVTIVKLMQSDINYTCLEQNLAYNYDKLSETALSLFNLNHLNRLVFQFAGQIHNTGATVHGLKGMG